MHEVTTAMRSGPNARRSSAAPGSRDDVADVLGLPPVERERLGRDVEAGRERRE